jgi:two-component system phosphate regulon sensor histidine kinase PhoR
MDSDFVAGLLEAMPMPGILIGRDGRVAAANGPAQALFGSGMVARPYQFSIRHPEMAEAVASAVSGGRAVQARVVLTGPGSENVFRVHVTPVRGEGREGVLCAFEDVTGEEQIGQMRRDFVANVSHELRTPLTALLGFIETLRGAARDDPAARDRFLGIMAGEAGRMSRLVRDLLSLSRVEAEERIRPTEQIDVAALAASAVAMLRPMAEEAGVALTLESVKVPRMVAGDADQITQVLHNLIENAIKYGGAGGQVGVRLVPADAEPWMRGPMVAVSVADHGEGIDPIHIPRLTERFYRVDAHRSRAKGGTGLGLAIVKHIVNRHRGRLRIDSQPGEGSTFTVLLPSA